MDYYHKEHYNIDFLQNPENSERELENPENFKYDEDSEYFEDELEEIEGSEDFQDEYDEIEDSEYFEDFEDGKPSIVGYAVIGFLMFAIGLIIGLIVNISSCVG